MQQRAGLLFLSKSSGRLLLILDDDKWSVPTFIKKSAVLDDAAELLKTYSNGRILPIELYRSADNGFEYGTYVCLVDQEFLVNAVSTYCWANVEHLPKNIHVGLKNTLNNDLTRTKLETILVITNDGTNTRF